MTPHPEQRGLWRCLRYAVQGVLFSGSAQSSAGWLRRSLYTRRAGRICGTYTRADMVGSSVVGFIFDTGLEYARLANNPYLTGKQKFWRSTIVGGAGVGWGLVVIATVGTGPVGFAVSLFVGWTVEKWTSDFIIGLFPGLEEQRRYRPLP